jgi:transposase-like protein
MNEKSEFPQTLHEAIKYFAKAQNAFGFLKSIRWPDGKVKCPRCGSEHVSFLSTRRIWKCQEKHERQQFSVKVGTVLEDSPISLDKWLCAFWLIANCKNGISSYELAKDIGVTQKSAWFMLHRIRLTMQDGLIKKFSGRVEVDETCIGGKARNMRPEKRAKLVQKGRGAIGKVAVMGLLEFES